MRLCMFLFRKNSLAMLAIMIEMQQPSTVNTRTSLQVLVAACYLVGIILPLEAVS